MGEFAVARRNIWSREIFQELKTETLVALILRAR
jgi:hypothetical protein